MKRETRLLMSLFTSIVLALSLAACDNDSNRGRTPPPTTPPPPPPPPPAEMLNLDVTINDEQAICCFLSDGSGTATVVLNLDTGAVSIDVSLQNISPDSVSLYQAYAGDFGDEVFILTDNGGGSFSAASNASLTTDQIAAVQAGQMYIGVVVDDDEEIRGQLLPDNLSLDIFPLSVAQEVPLVRLSDGEARAYVTLNTDTNIAQVHFQEVGLTSDIVGAHLHVGLAGNTGPVGIALTEDTDDGHYFAQDADFDIDVNGQNFLDRYNSARVYANIHTTQFTTGEVRGQFIPDGFRLVTFPLNTNQEVPLLASPSQAWGQGALTVDDTANTASVFFNFKDLSSNIINAGGNDLVHLHVGGEAGTTAPVGVTLTRVGAAPAGAADEQRFQALDFDITAQLGSSTEVFSDALNTARVYANIHTTNNGSGELRGQLVTGDADVFFFTLSTDEEVPLVSNPSNGNGTGALTVNRATNAGVSFINVRGLTGAALAVHLHAGASAGDASGLIPILLEEVSGLTLPAGEFRYSDTKTDLSNFTVEAGGMSGNTITNFLDLLDDAQVYANLHTAANPGGELRAQLVPDTHILYTFDINTLQEVPIPNGSIADGRGALTLDIRDLTADAFFNVRNLSSPLMGAHLHSGAFAGDTAGVAVFMEMDANSPGNGEIGQPQLRLSAEGFSALDPNDTDFLFDLLFAQVYANVHTANNMSGEIRGQVIPSDYQLFSFPITVEQEVPLVDPASTNAEGVGALTYNIFTRELASFFNLRNLSSGVGAVHLHAGAPAGETTSNIPILLEETATPGRYSDFQFDAASIVAEAGAGVGTTYEGFVDDLYSALVYANVHTANNPAGEIRGQVVPPGMVLYTFPINTLQEVPLVASATSMASGYGALTVDTFSGMGDVFLNVQNLAGDFAAAHLHSGAFAGNTAGVAITLTTAGSSPGDGTVGGGQLRLSAEEQDFGMAASGAFIGQLLSAQVYANVHTAAVPSGEIRGQIVPANYQVYVFPMSPDQEVPPVAAPGAFGAGALTINQITKAGDSFINVTGLSGDPVGQHFHSGAAAGANTGIIPISLEATGTMGRYSDHKDNLTSFTPDISGDDPFTVFLQDLANELVYGNIHTAANTGGEVRGQITADTNLKAGGASVLTAQ